MSLSLQRPRPSLEALLACASLLLCLHDIQACPCVWLLHFFMKLLHIPLINPLRVVKVASSFRRSALNSSGCLSAEHTGRHAPACVVACCLHIKPASHPWCVTINYTAVPSSTKIINSCYNDLYETSQVAPTSGILITDRVTGRAVGVITGSALLGGLWLSDQHEMAHRAAGRSTLQWMSPRGGFGSGW